MQSILRWENMLNCRPSLEVDTSYFLWFLLSDTTTSYIWGRVRRLTIKIYQKMLCISRDLYGTEYITIDGLDHVHYAPFYSLSRNRIVLSYELLDRMTMEGRIASSFTNFITTQELSSSFYISPDIYHTQITEYSLQTFQR